MGKEQSIKHDFNFKLEDLIDIHQLQTLQIKMNDIYPFPSSIIDNEGKILVTSAWQEICSNFHRKNPASEKKCIQSDKYISRLIDDANPVVSCRCPHGMIDTAVPIVIDGHHLANFFTGQIFLEPPDINVFKKQARKYGYNEKKYLEALKKVPVWSQEKLDKYLSFAKHFTEMLAEIGYKNLQEEKNRKKLKESELRFKNLADLIPQPVWETDLKTNITYFNQASYDLSGYTQEDFENGLTVLDLIVPEDRQRIQENYSKLLRGFQFSGDEYTCLRKDGTGFPILIYSSLITSDGKSVGVRGIALDITDRKKIEEEKVKLHEQLLHSQKMEALGALAGGIAHDFNNILGVIMGYSELFSFNLPDDSPMKKNVKKILNSSKKAKKLIQQILMFSRKSQGSIKPLRISKIIKETVKLLRSSIPSTIKIRTRIPNNLSPVLADETQVNQVIMNLCTNAAHSMKKEGGLLDITLLEYRLEHEAALKKGLVPGMYQILTIGDTGCGIPAEIMNRIFEPYFTTKEAGEGTGLGLSVVHGIVKSHRGTITVDSKLGKGTTVNIYLPLTTVKISVTDKTDREIPVPHGHENILLVDDDQALLEMSRQMLEDLGYKVIQRTSSVEALEYFKVCWKKIDLVITDMTMPNMTGEKLAGEMMKIRSDIPVILCTGFSEGMSQERAASFGIKGFLMKPVVMKELSGAIRAALT